MDITELISLVIGLLILVSVVYLIKTGRLLERYAIVWLFSSILICIMSVSRGLLEFMAGLIGIHYPPSLLFLLGVIFLIVINISFSVTISKLSGRVERLSQEIGILKNMIERKDS